MAYGPWILTWRDYDPNQGALTLKLLDYGVPKRLIELWLFVLLKHYKSDVINKCGL